MSWLETPCRITLACDRICEAINERIAYMHGGLRAPIQLPRYPILGYRMASNIRKLRNSIHSLYAEHFPPVFGEFTPPRPYGSLTENEVNDAIAAELQKANIDPAGYFMTPPPHRLSDGNFVRACYHLLNNVVLYRVPDIFSVRIKVKWSAPGSDDIIFDNDDWVFQRYKNRIVASFDDGRGYYGEYERYYYVPDNYYGPGFVGNWKARFNITLVFRCVENYTQPEVNESRRTMVDESCEVNFPGNRTDYMPTYWCAEILKNIDYYRNVSADLKYIRQVENLSAICVTKENLPPPNYKYLDL
jgi:hypothetical protein